MNNKNSIIIGAGASGLVGAIVLARQKQRVTLLEQNSKIGKKILVSGNGRCNITNRNITLNRFYSSNLSFVQEVLKGYSSKEIEDFFNTIGLELIEEKEGKMFPLSLQASSVVELLEYEAKRLGVEILCNTKVTAIEKKNGLFLVQTSQGEKKASHLILASGSSAYPQLGGSNSGYAFATKMGHSLIARHPSLVQLCSDESWVKACSGVKVVAEVTLFVNKEQIVQKRGDILFTNYGISGLAILDLSREVSTRLASFDYCELSLDVMPHFSKEKLTSFLLGRINKTSSKPLDLWLQGVMNKKLALIIIKHAKTKAKVESELNTKEIKKLVHTLKNLKLSIGDTKGFKHAEVATGGIDTTAVNPKTMESKIVKNLYFIGEILDVDGDRGGFNFHFAWVCGLRLEIS